MDLGWLNQTRSSLSGSWWMTCLLERTTPCLENQLSITFPKAQACDNTSNHLFFPAPPPAPAPSPSSNPTPSPTLHPYPSAKAPLDQEFDLPTINNQWCVHWCLSLKLDNKDTPNLFSVLQTEDLPKICNPGTSLKSFVGSDLPVRAPTVIYQ